MKIDEAKQLYFELSSLHGARFGPYVMIDKTERQQSDSLHERANKMISELNFSRNQVEVPSPWHAVILLNALAKESIQLKQVDNSRIKKFATVLGMNPRLIFRGQSDSRWPLKSKIQREEVNKSNELKALAIFKTIMKSTFPSLPEMGETAFEAIAQHYGIATNLLDFTLDPSVSVCFASNASSANNSQRASVFVLRLSDAFRARGKIILPPPFVERLYIQKGLFVESPISEELRKFCILEVNFPPDPSFTVIREGLEISVMGQNDNWLGKLVTTARKASLSNISWSQDNFHLDSLLPELNLSSLYRKWFAYTLEILYWTAITIYDGIEIIETETLEPIVKDNLNLVESFAEIYATAIDTIEFDPQKRDNRRHQKIRVYGQGSN